ncbi:MAG: pirin family protein [Candidatus Caenarcaniphilales bacterium]|nr:pirin family protein [Candidatus Caenarcaniphilales bacterium]
MNTTKQNIEKIIRASDRGSTKISWLNSLHTFSFANYYDPDNKGFKNLRVLNDDFIDAESGFDLHPHFNMEILTYVLEGELSHFDTLGNSGTIKAGEFQLISGGDGLMHSEHNKTKSMTRFLQIWIKPNAKGGEPGYQQSSIEDLEKDELGLLTVSSAMTPYLNLKSDVEVKLGKFSEAKNINLTAYGEKAAYIHMISGDLKLDFSEDENLELNEGDGVALNDIKGLKLDHNSGTEYLLFLL